MEVGKTRDDIIKELRLELSDRKQRIKKMEHCVRVFTAEYGLGIYGRKPSEMLIESQHHNIARREAFVRQFRKDFEKC